MMSHRLTRPSRLARSARASHGSVVSSEPSHGPRPGRVVGHLALLNLGIAASGLLTAPVLARGLGVRGRGDLAAIVVPLAVVTIAADFGLGAYVSREAARGRPLSVLVGSIGATVAAIAAVVAVALLPLVGLLSEGRGVVQTWLRVGLVLLPVALVINMLGAIARGLEDWPRFIRYRLVSPVGYVVAVVGLALVGGLTVPSVALALTVITLVSALPLLPLVRAAMPLRVDRSTAREGLAFGARTWLGILSNLANQRLDQLLMVPLVSRDDLGRYAVAASISVAPLALSGALGTTALPRAARGGVDVVARSVRVVVAASTIAAVVLGLLAGPIVSVLLGDEFAGVEPMLRVLLLAVVPFAVAHLLQQSLIGAGRPDLSSWSESLALAITGPGLLITLPRYGAIAAAWVSFTAYLVTVVFLLAAARRVWGGRIRDFLLATPADLRLGAAEVRGMLRRSADPGSGL